MLKQSSHTFWLAFGSFYKWTTKPLGSSSLGFQRCLTLLFTETFLFIAFRFVTPPVWLHYIMKALGESVLCSTICKVLTCWFTLWDHHSNTLLHFDVSMTRLSCFPLRVCSERNVQYQPLLWRVCQHYSSKWSRMEICYTLSFLLFVCLFSYSTFQKVYLNFLKEKRQYNMMYLYIGYVNHCLTNTSYNWFQISVIFWTQINFLCKSPSGLIDFFEVLIKQSQLYWEFFFIYHVTSQIQKCVI